MNKKYSRLFLLFCLILLFTANNLFALTTTAPLYGSGTSNDPYLIYNLENLNWIAEDASRWTSYYIQVADIDASETAVNGWTPIGGICEPGFQGSYDGQNYTIDHLHGSCLFSLVDPWATISNLGITNCQITGAGYVGGLCGTSAGILTNCYVTGTIQGIYAGGLIGMSGGVGTINNCYSDADVSGGLIGGLIGWSYNDVVTNCYTKGSVTDNSGNNYAGGLIGFNSDGAITNCYSTAEVLGIYADHGGLIGFSHTTVTNSFWDVETSGQTTSAGGTGKTTAEMTTNALNVNYSTNIYLSEGWDFKGETSNGTDNIWNIGNGRNSGYPYHDWQYPDDYPSLTMSSSIGDGSSGNPYRIASWQNLYWMSQNSGEWDKCYIQTSDIDLATALPAISTWSDNTGWTPLGNEATKFTGTYNGQDYTIDGLYIDRTASCQAMFGYTDGSTIQNLGLIKVDITNNTNYVGGLVAFHHNSSEIENCYSTGSVTCTVGWDTGGLIGANHTGSTVSNCYSTCTVNGDGNTGGLVGWNYGGSTISQCYSSGNVSSNTDVSHVYTGGLVGLIQAGTVEKSYSIVNVNGKNNTGGFAGSIYQSTISNCYNVGDVTRISGTDTFFDGFAGYVEQPSTIEFCYSTGSVFQSDGVAWADGTKGFVGGEDGGKER